MKQKSFKDEEESSTSPVEKIIFIVLGLAIVCGLVFFLFVVFQSLFPSHTDARY